MKRHLTGSLPPCLSDTVVMRSTVVLAACRIVPGSRMVCDVRSTKKGWDAPIARKGEKGGTLCPRAGGARPMGTRGEGWGGNA